MTKRKPSAALQIARPKARPGTLAAALNDYCRYLRVEGKASAAGAVRLADKTLGRGSYFLSGRFALSGTMALTSLSAPLLTALREARKCEGNGPQTIAHELKLLRAALCYAQAEGQDVPFIRWRIPTAPSKTRWLTREEWQRVYDELEPMRPVPRRQSAKPGAKPTPPVVPFPELVAARQQAQDLLVALTLTGGRWSEIRTLTVDRVRPDGLYIWGSKTQRERLVPCPGPLLAVLRRRREVAEAAGSIYLFPGQQQGPQKQSEAIRRAVERAGLNAPHLVAINGRATIHSLRHTFASWLVQDGMTIAEVQQLLGHTTMMMTRRYSHLGQSETVDKAAQKLSSLFDNKLE